MVNSEKPPIIDAEFEDVTPSKKDRRPFWERYEITFDWRMAMIGGALGLMGVLATLKH